jgi:DNA invertase Pin-like site-specific DNA recombinase
MNKKSTREILGYLRVSTLGQTKNESSLEGQELSIREYAVINGLVDDEQQVKMFWDRGKAAFNSKTEKRVGWTHMMNFAEKGDVVIAATIDRCFRSVTDATLTIESLRNKGIDLHIVDIGCITKKNSKNISILEVFSKIASSDSKLKATRIKDAKTHMAANFLYNGGRRSVGFSREMIGNHKFLVVNQLEKQLLLFVAEAKKKRDAEMKKFNIGRVKDKSEWSLINIRKKLIEKIIAFGIDKKYLLDEEQLVYGFNPYGTWDESQRNRNSTDDSGDEQGKLFLHENDMKLYAERMAFSISTVHHLVSDDEKRNVHGRLAKIKEAEKKIRLINGKHVLAKDLAGTSKSEGTVLGHRQRSLLSAGMRSKQKKDKTISTRRKAIPKQT